jgi:N-acetylneuraminic acid mutarotase
MLTPPQLAIDTAHYEGDIHVAISLALKRILHPSKPIYMSNINQPGGELNPSNGSPFSSALAPALKRRIMNLPFLPVIKRFAFSIAFIAIVFTSPAQNTWTKKSDFGGNGRYGAVGFSIDQKGYIGTGYAAGGPVKDLWEYDPDSDTWTQKADFGGTARYSAVAFSIGSKGYVGTGYSDTYEEDFWEYDPALNMWTQKADFLGTGRSGAIAFVISNKGYVGTGTATGGYKRDFFEYDPDVDTWTEKNAFTGVPRYGAISFSIGDKGYLGTGSALNGTAKDFWEYNPVADTWIQKNDFGGTPRYGAAAFVISGYGYVGTGGAYPLLSDFWKYDPITDGWTQEADYGTPSYFTVGFAIGSKGYIGTGIGDLFYKSFSAYTPGGAAPACNIPANLSTTDITDATAALNWDAVSGAIEYQVLYKPMNSPEWTLIHTSTNNFTIGNLVPNATYAWKVKSVCSLSPVIKSEASDRVTFTTASLKLTGTGIQEASVLVYPSPVQNSLTVQLATAADEVLISVFDLQGKRMALPATIENVQVHFNTSGLPAGLYTLQIINNKTGSREVRQFVKEQ